MIKTKTWVYCDACGEDITKEYQGRFDIIMHVNTQAEIEPRGRVFCKECAKAFIKWEKERFKMRMEQEKKEK